MTAEPSNFAEAFLQEAQELLDQLEQSLLDLESDPTRGDLIDSAFRALHTIKGSGAMFGFEPVAAFAHHVETAFDLVRQGRLPPGRPLIALALAAKDHIRLLIDRPGTEDPATAPAILAALGTLMEAAQPAAGVAADQGISPDVAETAEWGLFETPEIVWAIKVRLARHALSTGANPLLLLDELRELGEARIIADTSAVPDLDSLSPTECWLGWSIRLTTVHPKAMIEDVFQFVADEAELLIEAVPPPSAISESPAIAPPTAAPAAVAASTRAEQRPQRAADSVRVPAERLDDLMDRVGQLVIAQSRLTQVATVSRDPQLKAIAEDIERLALELRDSTMGVRTVPIISLFGRFRRLVHDLGDDLGKDIILRTVGEETELDKTVIEKLSDPLIHILRNAIDHGLESPEGRLAAGKPRSGQITLTASHAGADVLISVTDDGRGLDRARIRARAEERGLLTPGHAVTDTELLQVIFEPGFSTAAQITNLSGRGVGMDVVKRAIDALRGKIEITSRFGFGTEIALRLPLTLAIIDGLLVRVGHGRYVLPLSAVEECVELSAEQDARSRGRNFLNIRGDLVPFLRLRELFGAATAPDRYQKVVIVSFGKLRVGLVVDQVIGNHQTVIKSLSPLHATVEMFSGATILGDGTVALIMDVIHLVEFGQVQDEQLRAAG